MRLNWWDGAFKDLRIREDLSPLDSNPPRTNKSGGAQYGEVNSPSAPCEETSPQRPHQLKRSAYRRGSSDKALRSVDLQIFDLAQDCNGVQ